MAKTRTTKSAPSKKLDPTKATIYIAVVTLLGGIIVAAISNVDKLRASPQPQPKSQAEEIIAFQDHQYNEISGVLDERVSQAQAEETELTTPQQAKRALETEGYIKSNRDNKIAVAQKHAEFKAAVRFGDMFGANIIKTDVNALLEKEQERYLRRPGILRGSKTSLTMPSYCVVGLQALSTGRLTSERQLGPSDILGFVGEFHGR
jgi:hypothetical protein